jgi:hypothetical protein
MAEILQLNGADRRADRLRQADRGRLVAHVRRVRQVARAVDAREELIHERCLERSAARGVEHDRFRIELVQLFADIPEGGLPRDRLIFVGDLIVAHRLKQPALLFQIVIGPVEQFVDGMRREELRAAAPFRLVPDRSLSAVLAKLERPGLGGRRPGAGDAHIAVRLVLLEQRAPDAGRQ